MRAPEQVARLQAWEEQLQQYVDRLLDMCRTVVNVTGDMVACDVVDRQTADGAEPAAEPEAG